MAKAAADEAFQTVEEFVQSRRQRNLNFGKKFKNLQTVVIFRDKNNAEGKKPSTFKRLYTYFAILTAIFFVCSVIFTVIIATQWNAMMSDLPAGYVEVVVLLILYAVPAVQGVVWLVRLFKDGGRLKRNDALKIRGRVVGFQYEPYLQKTLSPIILAEGKRKAFHTFNENMCEGQTYEFLCLPATGIAVVAGEAHAEPHQNVNAE